VLKVDFGKKWKNTEVTGMRVYILCVNKYLYSLSIHLSPCHLIFQVKAASDNEFNFFSLRTIFYLNSHIPLLNPGFCGDKVTNCRNWLLRQIKTCHLNLNFACDPR